jgi:hypothetical protein
LDSWGLTVAGTFVFEGFTDPVTISAHLLKTLEIGTKTPVRGGTVLKAFEIRFQFERAFRRKAIDHPGSVSGAFDHALLAQVGQMLGNLSLRKTENFLEMADTKRTACKQMDYPKPRSIAETLVNPD